MKGIDIASYQGNVPWHELHDVDFGIVKVTEGEGYTNPYWITNAANLRAENKIRGFYTYSIPGLANNTPEADAAYFYAHIKHIIMPGDLIACDVEKTNYPDAGRTSDWTIRLLAHLQHLSGFKPLLYSYPDFIQTYLTNRILSQWPLWLAWYQDKLPQSFRQWKRIALWQKGPGVVRGVSGQVDIDIFFLGASELMQYGKPPLQYHNSVAKG